MSRRRAVAAAAGLIVAALALACNEQAGRFLRPLAQGAASVTDSFGAAERSPEKTSVNAALAAPARSVSGAEELDAKRDEGLLGGTPAGADPLGPGDGGVGALMIVRTGTASIETPAIDSAVARVRRLAAQVGGYVASSALQGGPEQARQATIEIKVPARDFDRLLAGLPPIGRVEAVDVRAEDVGEEYVDVAARMANDHRLEDRLVQLLGTRTGKLKDVLDVERELARVREEIERYEGRMRFLRAHAAISTLTLTVHEPVPVTEEPGAHPLVVALRQAWRNFIDLIAWLIASMGVVVPLGLIVVAGWLFHRRQRHQSTTATSAPPSLTPNP